jgi:hypothetical protein
MSVGGGGTGYLDSPDHMTLSPQQALARSHTAHHTPSKRDAATPEGCGRERFALNPVFPLHEYVCSLASCLGGFIKFLVTKQKCFV